MLHTRAGHMKNGLRDTLDMEDNVYSLQLWEWVLLHDLLVFGHFMQSYDVCVHLPERRCAV